MFANNNLISGNVTQTGGRIDNRGDIRGSADISGGLLVNHAGADIFGKTTISNTAQVTNAGGLRAVDVFENGFLFNGDTGTAGAVLNEGRVVNNGIVASLTNRGDGTFANNKEIAGNVVQTGGRIDNYGDIGGTAKISGGLLVNHLGAEIFDKTTISGAGQVTNAGTLAAVDVLGNDAFLFNATGGLTGGIYNTGKVINNGTVDSLLNAGGEFRNNSIIANLANVTGGTVSNLGRLEGGALVSGGGLINRKTILGLTVVRESGQIDNYGTTEAVAVQAGGTFLNLRTGTTGAVQNTGTFDNDGRVGSLVNAGAGTFINRFEITGDAEIRSGSMTNTGKVVGKTTVGGNGRVDNFRSLAAVDVKRNGIFVNDAGGTAGSVDNAGIANNAGTILSVNNLDGGQFTSTGTIQNGLNNAARGTAGISGTVNGAIDNDGTFVLLGDTTGNSTFVNDGRIFLGAGVGGAALTGLTSFTNNQNIFIDGALTIGASTFANDGSIVLQDGTSTSPGSTDDVFTVNGDITTPGFFFLDIDLSGAGPAADQVIINGNLDGTGAVVLNELNPAQRNLFSGGFIRLIDVADGYANTSRFSAFGLPVLDQGLINYYFVRHGNDWVLSSFVNPAAGSIAGSIALVNSLIGTVVNRPSSPFVSGIGYEPESPCGLGPWSRAVGGTASAEGETTGGFVPQLAKIDVHYGGVQFGGDLQCFNIGKSGWDIAIGGFGGYNLGKTSQSLETNQTATDFDQFFGGGYVSAAKGQFAAELQARLDYIDFVFDNPNLGLVDYEAEGIRTSLSGSASYALPMGDYIVVPTAGFSLSQMRTDNLVFNDVHSLEFDDEPVFVGFAGATIARNFLNDEKTAALRPFATATIYSDFGAEAKSIFTDSSTGEIENLSSQSLGTFGEVSLGLDYVKVLGENAAGVRQLNATVRGDARFSDRLLGGSATVQLRLQF
jgi:hypothetical protein